MKRAMATSVLQKHVRSVEKELVQMWLSLRKVAPASGLNQFPIQDEINNLHNALAVLRRVIDQTADSSEPYDKD